jgi:hypothetical protein
MKRFLLFCLGVNLFCVAEEKKALPEQVDPSHGINHCDCRGLFDDEEDDIEDDIKDEENQTNNPLNQTNNVSYETNNSLSGCCFCRLKETLNGHCSELQSTARLFIEESRAKARAACEGLRSRLAIFISTSKESINPSPIASADDKKPTNSVESAGEESNSPFAG